MSVDEFLSTRPYQPDPFQWEAARAVEAGRSVVVTAPTGAGKTLVAEAAVHLALERGKRIFYTTPIKALSNQKYGDFVDVHGKATVGLLTGDNVINGDGRIVVMTTEVLRNMIYADPDILSDVGYVVLDEVHYLQDPFRGGVWEEVIIHAPHQIQLVCLSATVANAEEFCGWVRERRGPTELVITRDRPVPLESLYMLADRHGDPRVRMLPMFTERDGRRRPNQKLEHLLSLERGRRSRFSAPRRPEVIETLAEADLLPAIYFIFSRAGCEAAAVAVLESGIRLIDADQRDEIRAVAEERTDHLSDADLRALDYGRWLAALEHGVAPHHAGMVPAFKETVEALFTRGLLKAVFATETLALGINMPARTVVLESLSKFDGEGHSLIGPGDYTQLTGRAGRRGIDVEGFGVVLHSRFVRFDQVTQIASRASHPLRSSFRPTYNMAANLVANYPQDRAEELLSASFAQYQREGSEADARRHISEMEARLGDELARAECERGSITEYVAQLDRSEERSARGMIGTLHPGDVIDVPGGRREGRFVVLRRLSRGTRGGARVLVLGTSGRTSTLSDRDLVGGTRKVGLLELPRPFRGNDRKLEQLMLRRLRKIPRDVGVPERPGRSKPDHPVAACPDADRHVKWFRKAMRTERRLSQLRDRVRAGGVGLIEEFRSIESLLGEWGYLDGWELTARGERLRFVYNELDLLLTEAIERGIFWSLGATDLVALASCFVYEPRTDHPSEPHWPTAEVGDRYRRVSELWEELVDAERRHRLTPTRRPDPGFAAASHAWALDRDLEDLPDSSMAAGDFVRVSRQLVDLLRQLRDAFPELSQEASEALRAIDRGVVAAQGVG